MAERPRRASIAQRLLARARRAQDHGGARLTASVVARRRLPAQALAPRLLPQRETRGRAPMSLARQAERPTATASEPAVAAPEGMSEFAAEWLFGEGDVQGTPFAGGAALPVSGRPAFLPAPNAPTPATAARAPRSNVRQRGRVQEGPMRLSAIPPAQGEAPPLGASAPASDSPGAGETASDAPVRDPAPTIDRSSSSDPAPTEDLAAAPASTSLPHSPAVSAGLPTPAQGQLAAPDPTAAADTAAEALLPPAQAAPLMLAPKRRSEPASTPPARAPVVLQRVPRPSVSEMMAAVVTVPGGPPRGLLRRALDRVLALRSAEQTGVAPAGALGTAEGGSGAARVGAPPGAPAGARVARAPTARPDAPASRRGGLSQAGPIASADRSAAPRLHNPLQGSDPASAARTAMPPSGAPVDRAPVEGSAASPALSQAEMPLASAPDLYSAPPAPASGSKAPTLARVVRPAGGAGSTAPAEKLGGVLTTRGGYQSGSSPSVSRKPSRPGAPTSPAGVRGPSAAGAPTSAGASVQSASLADRDVRASAAAKPGGLRRALARLRIDRSPVPPPQESFASEHPAGTGPIEGAPAESPTDEPTTILDTASGPWLAPAPATGGTTPQLPPALGEAGDSEIPAHPSLSAPGIARAASDASGRPPVRLRRVPARIFSPLADLRSVAPSASVRPAARPRPGAPTSGERLADATGASLRRELAGGRETIEFFPGDSDASADVLARASAGAAGPGAAANPAAPAAAEAPVAPGAPAAESGGAMAGGASASHAGASPEADDMYEHIIERLRRDLLTERERMGDLLGDLP